MTQPLTDILTRIQSALKAASDVLDDYTPGRIAAEDKGGGDPVTEADRKVDDVLKKTLLRDGEGWLSEETVDDRSRLDFERVWIVDPLDGTREFVAGIPEWCVSIGYVVNGSPVAGGICNPQTKETIIGAVGEGVTYNGAPVSPATETSLTGGVVLASRSETRRGEWDKFEGMDFEVKPCGSVAYKFGLTAANQCTATWTLVPKHEWDVAAGVALVTAAGGFAVGLDGNPRKFNQPNSLLSGLIAGPMSLKPAIDGLLNPIIAEMTR